MAKKLHHLTDRKLVKFSDKLFGKWEEIGDLSVIFSPSHYSRLAILIGRIEREINQRKLMNMRIKEFQKSTDSFYGDWL